jgi:hypothetical protein
MSHHHPSNKRAVLVICDEDSLGQELEFLKTSLRENSYSLKQIQWVFSRREENPNSTAFLPYVQLVSSRLNRMLRKHNIRGINLPLKKVFDCLRPVKDDLRLKIPGVYCIPCECGKVYVGQSGHTIETSVKEYRWHVCHSQPEKSAVAEYNINHDHIINFQEM